MFGIGGIMAQIEYIWGESGGVRQFNIQVMAADEKYFEDTYSKLLEYLLKKGYRKDLILNPCLEGNVMTVGIVSSDLKNLNESYYIVEGDKIDLIKEIVEDVQGQAAKLFPKNANYYAVNDSDEGLKITEIRARSGTVLTFYKQAILSLEAEEDEQIFYRGHSDAMNHFLTPGIYRPLPDKTELAVEKEDILYKEAVRRCPEDFDRCRSAFEHMVKMQHYRVPTRLLDITTNPLVALYFACAENPGADGEVYAFRVKKPEIKYFDSDAVSVVANLARRPADFVVPPAQDKEAFNTEIQIQYLLHEIKYEKPHFLDLIDREDLGRVFCVLPKLNNPRIIRQSGAFFLFGIDGGKRKQAEFRVPFRRFTISAAGKKRILSDLARLGIDEATLFPELEMVADHLKRFGI